MRLDRSKERITEGAYGDLGHASSCDCSFPRPVDGVASVRRGRWIPAPEFRSSPTALDLGLQICRKSAAAKRYQFDWSIATRLRKCKTCLHSFESRQGKAAIFVPGVSKLRAPVPSFIVKNTQSLSPSTVLLKTSMTVLLLLNR